MEQTEANKAAKKRLAEAIRAVREGRGVLITDDETRENEGDLIFPAETMTEQDMALMIRYCSGIVCLCLPAQQVEKLGLQPMVAENNSRYQTAFTVSIEAAVGVTTGVSAADRITTIRAAIAKDAAADDLCSPGHVFPLQARGGGVAERAGHTEATVDLMRLAGLQPYGVLCELMNDDGSMARKPQVDEFGARYQFPVLTVQDILYARQELAVIG